jgi:hypothetical protein
MAALSPQQVAHFETFGFVHLKALFSKDEVATLQHEMQSAHEAAQLRDPFPENTRRGCRMLSDRTPLFQSLSEDERFLGAARQMYGDVFSYGCDAGYYVGDTQWHAGEPESAPTHTASSAC